MKQVNTGNDFLHFLFNISEMYIKKNNCFSQTIEKYIFFLGTHSVSYAHPRQSIICFILRSTPGQHLNTIKA